MRWLPLLLLSACGPVTGVALDAAVDVPAALDVAILDAADAQETAAPDVASEPAAPDAPVCEDRDRDGHGAVPCGDDCDDADPRVYPGPHPGSSTCTLRDSRCVGVSDLERTPDGASAWCQVTVEEATGMRGGTYGCVHPQPGRWTYGGCMWCPNAFDGGDGCLCWDDSTRAHPCRLMP